MDQLEVEKKREVELDLLYQSVHNNMSVLSTYSNTFITTISDIGYMYTSFLCSC